MSKKVKAILVGVLLALVAACGPGSHRSAPLPPPGPDAGGSSGLVATRLVSSLSSAEARTLCEYAAAVTSRTTVSCDGGLTIEPIAVDSCAASIAVPPAGCAATVGDVEGCFEAMGANPCVGFSSAACAPILACGRAA